MIGLNKFSTWLNFATNGLPYSKLWPVKVLLKVSVATADKIRQMFQFKDPRPACFPSDQISILGNCSFYIVHVIAFVVYGKIECVNLE